jgi:tartrate-resistant acid phosphatase type 5
MKGRAVTRRDSAGRRHASVLLLVALAATIGLAGGCSHGTPEPRPIATTPEGSPRVPSPTTRSPESTTPVTFAVIGDYGTADAHERAVAALVESWHPAYILALGDDYYGVAGGSGTGRYDNSTGAFYGAWIAKGLAVGANLPPGQPQTNAFFPALGNHDYSDAVPSPQTCLAYFDLPGRGFANTSGNERYYDFIQGQIHYYVLNSNPQEPDGVTSTSKQATWLKAQLAASTSRWNIVYDHHPPYSSDNTHGSTASLQWPFAEWGADVVMSGHAHVYERVMRDGIVYFVDGLGGAPRYGFSAPVAGSAVRYSADWGALRVTATGSALVFEFRTASGQLVDRYRLSAQ